LYARDRVSELTLVPRDGSFSWSWVDVDEDSADDDGLDSRFDLRREGTLKFNVLLPGEVDRATRSWAELPQDDCDFLPSLCLGVCPQPLYCELPSNTYSRNEVARRLATRKRGTVVYEQICTRS
jgi:hypothetical protein